MQHDTQHHTQHTTQQDSYAPSAASSSAHAQPLHRAMNIRRTIRRYASNELSDEATRRLEAQLDAMNLLGDLHLQYVPHQPYVFNGADPQDRFLNAQHFIALIGKDDNAARERAGFFGERIVLDATLQSLGTCWVAGSLHRQAAAQFCSLRPGEALFLVIVIGTPLAGERYEEQPYEALVARQREHRTTKTLEQLTQGMSAAEREAAPQWFLDGVNAVMKAPSAKNTQPILFSYNAQRDEASARIDTTVSNHYVWNDLGIAKLHFQLAARGEWQWGDGGIFHHQ